MSLRWWVFSTTVIAITGMTGLLFVLTQLYPTPIARVLFLALLFITFGAGSVPLSIYLNHRFAAKDWLRQDPNRLVRHGIESGLLVTILTYLYWILALDWTIAFVLIGVFILMETFFLTRN